MIVEKKPSGMLEIYDKNLNPVPNFKPSASNISQAIQTINSFYESK